MPSEVEISGGYGFGNDDIWGQTVDWHSAMRGGDDLFGPSLPSADFAYGGNEATSIIDTNSRAPNSWYRTNSLLTNGRSYSSRDPFISEPGHRRLPLENYIDDGITADDDSSDGRPARSAKNMEARINREFPQIESFHNLINNDTFKLVFILLLCIVIFIQGMQINTLYCMMGLKAVTVQPLSAPYAAVAPV